LSSSAAAALRDSIIGYQPAQRFQLVRPSGDAVIDLNLSDTSGGLAYRGPGQRSFRY